MRLDLTKSAVSMFLVLLVLAAGSVLAQNREPTTTEILEEFAPPEPFPAGPFTCSRRVGILGNYFQAQIQAFLVANGMTVSIETAASIGGGSLANLDALYITRAGVPDATAQAATIEAWVRGGGVLITEFDATNLLFDGATFGFFPAATLDLSSAVPSGTVCGGNTVDVTSPGNALAAGLPAVWACSGDPIGVFHVYNEATLDPAVDRVARISVDQNSDGERDLVVGTACVEAGAVVPFFTDFADWQALQNPRTCPSPPCNRSIEDETLLLNAICRVKENCRPQDHMLCYHIKPIEGFETREVLVRNQFGDQKFIVISPELLCVPSTKTELDRP